MASNNVDLPAPELPLNKHNLVEVAEKGRDAARWERGGGFVQFGCLKGFVQSPQCPPANLSPAQTCPGSALFYPILLEENVAWDTLTYEDARKEVEAALERSTSSLLEAEVELAAQSTAAGLANPHLSTGTALTGATSANAAVGLVQDWLINPTHSSAGMGTLFMSPSTAGAAEQVLDDFDTDVVKTKVGRWPVVVGNFTPGKVYGVTGLVDLYLGPIEVVEELSRVDNAMIISAQRLALVTFHTCAMVVATVGP